jgi:uncharacterized membrane protein YebE (DUF533 family)
MKKKTKENLLKGSIIGALGAAAAGGAAYLLSNKNTRKELGKVVKTIQEKGGAELAKVLKSVNTAKNKSKKKISKTRKTINSKNKGLD